MSKKNKKAKKHSIFDTTPYSLPPFYREAIGIIDPDDCDEDFFFSHNIGEETHASQYPVNTSTRPTYALSPDSIIDSDFPTPIKNKRARSFSKIAKALAAHFRLAIVDDLLFLYRENSGCYCKVLRPERLLDQFLESDQADQLTKRDCDEIFDRLKRLEYLQESTDTFNSRSNLINCSNGIVDLAAATALARCPQPHSPNTFFTYVVNARYIPHWDDRTCPTFDQFCLTSLDGDPVKRQLLLEMIGYICSDSTDGKCALFLKGAPDSGKSVVSEFVRLLFDETLVSSVPLHKLSDRFNKAELFGKKVNIAGEIKASKLTEITTFKMVTGGDRILAEYKGKDPFYFSPRCKLLFSGNALPGTSEADSTAAFVNRLVVLLFNTSIPKEQQDKDLLSKLYSERNAIFSLAVDALREVYYNNYQFSTPSDSKKFLFSYRCSENSVRAFVEDCCAPEPHTATFNCSLLAAYEQYCKANGLEVRPRQQLYDAIDALPGVTARRLRIGCENRRGRVGVKILPLDGTLEQTQQSLDPQAIPCSTTPHNDETAMEYNPSSDMAAYYLREGTQDEQEG